MFVFGWSYTMLDSILNKPGLSRISLPQQYLRVEYSPSVDQHLPSQAPSDSSPIPQPPNEPHPISPPTPTPIPSSPFPSHLSPHRYFIYEVHIATHCTASTNKMAPLRPRTNTKPQHKTKTKSAGQTSATRVSKPQKTPRLKLLLPPNPVYKPKARKPDIKLLHAKLVVACRDVAKREVYDRVVKDYFDVTFVRRPRGMSASDEQQQGQGQGQGMKSRTRAGRMGKGVSGVEERFYVLDGERWESKQYGSAWEAALMSTNPGIWIGGGVWLYGMFCLLFSSICFILLFPLFLLFCLHS